MAATLLSHVVSDLCIGRPRVLTLLPSTPITAALAAIRTAGADPFLFVDAEPTASRAKTTTVYVKVSVADILCYVCGDAGNLRDPAAALGRPVAVVVAAAVAAGHGVTHRVDPQTRYATQPARRRFWFLFCSESSSFSVVDYEDTILTTAAILFGQTLQAAGRH